MAGKDFNSLPIDEETLAALVEGDLGAPEAELVRERLLRADPGLAARVELMEQDRVMLRALGDESPPRGLAESVVARLEREALLGLAGTDAAARPPVSRIQPVARRDGFSRFLTSPAGAGLALAAVVTLTIGAALQFMGPKQPTPAAPGPVADNGSIGGETAIARSDGAASSRVAGEPAREAEAARTAPAVTVAAIPDAERFFNDDPDRALALLREGRLLIRVRAAAPESATEELARIIDRPRRANEAFRLAREVNGPVMAAMGRHFAPAAPERSPLAFAAAENLSDRSRVDPVEVRSTLSSVYLADARADGAALAALLAALSLGDGKVAVFEELAEPVELAPVLTAESVLWWSRPPSDWAHRAYVPVVVERVER